MTSSTRRSKREPPVFSPSSLANIELCPRRFAWDKVDRVPRSSNPYAEFGKRTHGLIEDYYLRGTMPDLGTPEGNCAVALLAHLPPPQPGVRCEEHRIVGRFHGYPDLTLGPRVWDHKTTSDLKWAKTELATDLQAALYAHFIMAETGELRVRLQWNYVTRHKPRVLPVIREVTFADIVPTLDRAHRLADQGQAILDAQTPALELPPNPAACDMYGGCQHRERCNLTPSQRLGALLDQADRADNPGETMSTAAEFLSKMNQSHPPAPPPPPNPWDGLPATHVNATQWYDPARAAWVDKAPQAPPPPPPAAVAPPVPINPPPVAQTMPAAPPAPPATIAEAVQAHADTPASDDDVAIALDLLAAVRAALGGPKRGPGRPRKVKP